MSTPIKPSGGPAAPPSPEAVGGAKPAEGAGESFRAALEGAQAEGVSSATPRAAAHTSEVVAAIASDLAAGRIDAPTAVDRLVERALGSATASALPPARRVELEQLLRTALADDPSLAALTKDLDRSG